jgi:hypothetical protein
VVWARHLQGHTQVAWGKGMGWLGVQPPLLACRARRCSSSLGVAASPKTMLLLTLCSMSLESDDIGVLQDILTEPTSSQSIGV